MAQFGKISGHVYRYTNNAPLSGVTVAAFDEMSEQRGSKTTNSSGYYEITSLPADSYRVCARKTGYVTECYQRPYPSDPNGCSYPDCGFFWIADPEETQGSFVDVIASHTTQGIDFYIARGGSIEGNISGAVADFSYQVILDGEIQYKNSGTVPIKFILNKEGNHFFNPSTSVIPPGVYTLRAEDTSPTYPYYYTVYYDGATGTYKPKDAKKFTFLLDQPTSFKANFTIERGGFIKGRVMERFKGQFVGIFEAMVTVKENNLGLEQSTQTNEIYEDPNTGIIYKGLFAISGLPPGTYIMLTDDTFITDPNNKIYLPEYYNNVYFENQATSITISEADINDPDYEGVYIEVVLQHGPVIEGWTIEHDPEQCDPNQYDPEKALKGMTIELVPTIGKEANTELDGYYIFNKSDKILPGSYQIRAKDTNFKYYPTAYQTITVSAAKTYEVNFCMTKVPPFQGKGSISGHIFLNENMDNPLPGISIVTLDKISGGAPQDTITDNNGEYFFNNLNPGEYILGIAETYGDLILEFYKDICNLDPNKFPYEGKFVANHYMSIATPLLLLPGENKTNVDIGLSTYQYTFGSGLNLFGYPGLPVEKYDDTHEFCSKLGSGMHNFRWKNPGTGQWYVITSSLEKSPIKLRTGQGYIIYMNNKAGPILFPPFKSIPPKEYHLTPGKNFIAYPSSLHRDIKKSSDLLTALGTPDEVANVQSFDNLSGKWKSTVWLWNRPGASDFRIVQGEGYLVEMRSYKTLETDEPHDTAP